MASQMLDMEEVRLGAARGAKPHQHVLEGCCLRGAERATVGNRQALHFTPSRNTSRGEEFEVLEELYLRT